MNARGQAQRIVIREQQLAFRLDQVGAEQQVIVRAERRAGSGQEMRPRRAGRSCRCSTRGMPRSVGLAILGRQAEQPILVGRLVRGHA